MINFKDRPRLSLEEAKKAVKEATGWICHLIQNGEWEFNDREYTPPTYSVMMHINCEWCDYCDAANVAYRSGIRYSTDHPLIHLAKEDPYENEKNDTSRTG